MKKMILAMMVISTILMAEPYTQADRIKHMNKMANAMNIIQSGIFYNNYRTVEAGVKQLTDTIQQVKPPIEEVQEEDLMTKYMNNKIQVTNKIVKKINKKSMDILQRFKDGDSAQAVQAYTKIMEQCIKCHRKTRNW